MKFIFIQFRLISSFTSQKTKELPSNSTFGIQTQTISQRIIFFFGEDNHSHAVSYFFSLAAYCCFLAYSFLMSLSLCRYFCARENVLVESFLHLKLKLARAYLFGYYFPLSKIISVSSLALSFPSASISYKRGI